MANRVATPVRKPVLKQNTSIINEEKENRQGVIFSEKKVELVGEADDDESDDWSAKRRPPLPNYVTNADGGSLRRRQMRTSASSQASAPSHVIARRNERERNRVRQVNESFAVLRSRIPDYLYDLEAEEKTKQARRKLSKVETLRLAVDYIQQLETLLNIKPDLGPPCDESDDDPFSSNDGTTLCCKSEFESEHEADVMDLSRDGMCQDDDLSSDGHSSVDKPYLSTINLVERSFPITEVKERNLSIKSDKDQSDDSDYASVHSPLPNISQSFPSVHLGYPTLYM